MYAVVQTGGKQYRVSEGDIINVEKLNVEAGQTVALEDVLVIGGEEMIVGKPFIEGAAVTAEVLENGKGPKLYIYKYKAKKDYRKKQGHRQPYTQLKVTGIVASGYTAPAAETKAVSYKSMKKAELVEFAASKGIELDAKSTKDEMIAVIEAAINK